VVRISAALSVLSGAADATKDWQDCPIYPTTNRIGVATNLVGCIGLLLALSVILIIYAHRKDQAEIAHRIILGLTVCSAVYSAACIFPLQAYEPDCTSVIRSYRAGAWLRMVWFATKCAFPTRCCLVLCASAAGIAFTHLMAGSAHHLPWAALRPILAFHCHCILGQIRGPTNHLGFPQQG